MQGGGGGGGFEATFGQCPNERRFFSDVLPKLGESIRQFFIGIVITGEKGGGITTKIPVCLFNFCFKKTSFKSSL